MFFVASKIFYFLITPLCWIVILLLLSIFTGKEGKRKFYTYTGVFFLVVFTNPFLINHIYKNWEYPAVSKDEIPLVKTGVVLGGMMESGITIDQYSFSSSSERILESIILVNEGFLRNLIISGGSGAVLDNEEKESIRLKDFVSDITNKKIKVQIDTASRNTYENAVEVSKILEAEDIIDQPVLLITSSFHMKRALMCFEKQGIDCIPYPVDFQSKTTSINPSWMIPDYNALRMWDAAIKEWVGTGVYKIFGYV